MRSLSETARFIFEQALADVSVDKAVAAHVFRHGNSLHVGDEMIPFDHLRQLRIVAAGKAGASMLAALLRQLPPFENCEIAGVLIAPGSLPHLPKTFQYFSGGHPAPNQASFDGARAALALMQSGPETRAGEQALCLFLISGGASAMMELPLDPAIDLKDTVTFYRALVVSGASIAEINCVRKHFSAIKGGRLAMAAGQALTHSLLISDVPAGEEHALGSGPTLPDRSTVAECRQVLERYGLLAQFPPRVRQFFERPDLPETPKPAELHSRASILLRDRDLAQAASRRAEALGWTTVIDDGDDEQDYRAAAESLLSRLRELRASHARVCVVSAGEVRVRLPAATSDTSEEPSASVRRNDGRTGMGGRNQHFALYAATLFRPGENIAVLSAGSDGIDGNSPAAGAVVESETLGAGDASAAQQALEEFNSYPFLRARHAAILTGPTGNNLRDLRILLSRSPS